MSKRKNTGFKRFTSLLLALIMVVGLLPLSVMPVSAADGDPSYLDPSCWVNIKTGHNQTMLDQFDKLAGLLSNSSNKYLRLTEDLVLDEGDVRPFWEATEGRSNIQINGIKWLDLNGHKIVYRNDTNFQEGRENTSLFRVMSGASFTLCDLSDKGDGYITYEGPVNRYGGPERNVFYIEDGGKMTMNGGEIEAGRSKSVYLGRASLVFEDTSKHYYFDQIGTRPAGSYVRDQAPGCAVIVATGGELTVNKGALAGRSRLKVSEDYAAVYMQADSTVTINDAWLRGNGGASCIIVEEPEKNTGTPKAKLTIYSGVFDLKTPDFLRFDQERHPLGGDLWCLIHGPYGHIIMGLRYNEYGRLENRISSSDDAFRAGDFFDGDVYTAGLSRTKVQKNERDCTRGGSLDAFSYTDKEWTLYAQPDNEPNTWVKFISVPSTTWVVNTSAEVCADFNGYYPSSGRGQLNLCSDIMWYRSRLSNWESFDASYSEYAQIFDSKGVAVSGIDKHEWEIGSDERTAIYDIKDFKSPGGSAINYELGKRYTLRYTLRETWRGQHDWTIENYAEFSFIPVEQDIESEINFRINATENGAASDGSAAIKVTPLFNSTAASKLSGRLFSYGYVDYEQNESGGTREVKVYRRVSNSNESVAISGLPTGAQTLVGRLSGTENGAAGLYHEIFAYKDVFVMPGIQVRETGKTEYYPRSNDTIRTGSGYPVTLQAFDETAGLKYSALHPTKPLQNVVDPATGKTLTMSDVKWEMWDAARGEYRDVTDGDSGITLEGGRLITDRSGIYRAKIVYNNATWYSPQPMTVLGANIEDASRIVTVTSNAESMEWNDSSLQLTVQFNRNQADWGNQQPKVELVAYKQDVPAAAWENYMKPAYGSSNECVLKSQYLGLSATDDTFTYNLADYFGRSALQQENTVPGTYRFYARVIGSKLGNANFCTVLSQTPVTVKVEKRATGIDALVDGQNLTNGQAATLTPTYTMPSNTNTVKIAAQRVMADASLPGSLTTTYTSSDTSVAKVDSQGNLTALTPGQATITVTSYGKIKTGSGSNATEESVSFTAKFRVIVPIAGFKLGDEPDWQAAVEQGKRYEDVEIPVTHVKAYNGQWVANTNSRYASAVCTAAEGYRPFNSGSSTISIDTSDKVQYNDSVTATFRVKAKDGYQFMTAAYNGSSTKNSIDMHSVTANLPGSSKETTLALNGYWFDEYRDLYQSDVTDAKVSDVAARFAVKAPCVKDPDAVYLKTIAVSAEEPKEGDPRYQGDLDSVDVSKLWYTDTYTCNMMNVKVLTLENDTTTERPGTSEAVPVVGVYNSHVNKIANVTGSGSNYGMVDGPADLEYPNSTECDGIFLPYGTATKESILSHRYEAGTYVHELKLYAGLTNDNDGKKYYFDSDVQVFVNGRPVSLSRMIKNSMTGIVSEYSGYTSTLLDLYYYYVADESPAYNGATVTGLIAPQTGAMPQEAGDLNVTNVTRTGSTDLVDFHGLYVSRLEWFVDKNNNGIIDSGESCEVEANGNLSASGAFLPNTVYSAWIELATDSGRINNQAFTLRLDGVATPISTDSSKASYKFEETQTPPGVTVSGTATSFKDANENVIIQLCVVNDGIPASEATDEKIVKGNTAPYSFEGVLPGTYIIKVMKKNHVTREYTVTVGTENVTQDVKIHLLGDIDGNGAITIMDAIRANSHVRGVTLLTDYALKCADVVGTDGTVTNMDVIRINAHAKGMSLLW